MRLLDKIKSMMALIILAGLLPGCYATIHRGPRTLNPGQVSASASYLRFKGTKAEPEDNPVELIGFEGRVGVLKGLDIGYMRTIDISENVKDEGIDTYWFDAKLQILNRINTLNKPTMSLGYGFGKVINFEDFWVNTLYISLGVQTELMTLFYSFRYEVLDDEINWIPTWAWEKDFDDIRKAHILGLEYEMYRNFKPVIELGRFYSRDFSDGLNVVTAGFNFYIK
ncbi:MAG: hypothetical protein ACE5QV_02895 [Fidelibacterota bacterium]